MRDQGLTIVMVTHERAFAARASRQIVLRDGEVIEDIDQRSQSFDPHAPGPASGPVSGHR